MLADLPPTPAVVDTSAHADVAAKVDVDACPLLDVAAEAKLALHVDVD